MSLPIAQEKKIESAVEAFGKNQDPQKLLDILLSVDPETKKLFLNEAQQLFRQKFGKELPLETNQDNQEITISSENNKLAETLTSGAIKLPPVPQASVPLALSADSQKSDEQAAAGAEDADDSWWRDNVWAPAATWVSDTISQYVSEPVQRAASAVYNAVVQPVVDVVVAADNFVGKPLQTAYAAAVGDSVQEEEGDVEDVPSQESQVVLRDSEVTSGVDENGDALISMNVTYEDTSIPPPVFPQRQASWKSEETEFPEVPEEIEISSLDAGQPYWMAASLPPIDRSKGLEFPVDEVVSLTPKTEIDEDTSEKYAMLSAPAVPSVTIVEERTPSIFDLPLEGNESYAEELFASANEFSERKVGDDDEYDYDDEEDIDGDGEKDYVPNAILAAIDSFEPAAEIRSVAQISEQHSEHIAEVTRQVTAMVSGTITNTNDIQAAEHALVALADANGSVFEVQRIQRLIDVAKERLKTHDLENSDREERLFARSDIKEA